MDFGSRYLFNFRRVIGLPLNHSAVFAELVAIAALLFFSLHDQRGSEVNGCGAAACFFPNHSSRGHSPHVCKVRGGVLSVLVL